jgi:7-carboxy-7-deazaguanine synthase
VLCRGKGNSVERCGYKMIKVSEHFSSWQGTGHLAGTPQYFVRLAGCRQPCPLRRVCDEPESLAQSRLVTFDPLTVGNATEWWHVTGGEPLEQQDELAAEVPLWPKRKLHLQTSGLVAIEHGIWDWVTVSPKSRLLKQRSGNELVLVNDPKWVNEDVVRSFSGGVYQFDLMYLQPIEIGGEYNWAETLDLAKRTGWSITWQMHKIGGFS